MSPTGFPSLLQRFFVDRLVRQLGVSPHTVASYRDTFRLLLHFANDRLGRTPSELKIDDLDATFLVEFLVHLEKERHVCVRTRNTRLAALHSFFRYVAFCEPASALQCQRVLAIPSKRYERGPIEFLLENECTALIEAPDTGKWLGRRDHALLLLAIQTGLRNSEIISLTRQNALWLGHESTEATMIYMHADMQLKEKALKHASETNTIPERFQPPDDLLAFLERL